MKNAEYIMSTLSFKEYLAEEQTFPHHERVFELITEDVNEHAIPEYRQLFESGIKRSKEWMSKEMEIFDFCTISSQRSFKEMYLMLRNKSFYMGTKTRIGKLTSRQRELLELPFKRHKLE